MTLNLSLPQLTEMKPRIVVMGVGGAGGNAVNNMIRAELQGVEFVAANTDAQALAQSAASQRIQLGLEITQGLGAGARPDVGRAAAEEALELIRENLEGCNMTFIAAGMGGGTGTGAAPVIAEVAKELGILTVGVVTKPFHFEGTQRMRIAEQGMKELQQYVDTLIAIPNQNLFRIANERTTFADAFAMADQVLHSGVRGITDLMVMPGLINLDFADVRTVMNEMGKAMMGTGEAEGERRALEAAEAAISNPLLDDVSMKGARGVLINITGGMDLTLFEVDEAANRIRSEVDPDANIIVGSIFNERLEGRIQISVVATGIESDAARLSRPQLVATNDRDSAGGGDADSADTAQEIAWPAARLAAQGGQGTMAAAQVAEIPEPSEPEAESGDAAVPANDIARPAASGHDRPFLARTPVQPAHRLAPQGAPDPFRAAEMVNPLQWKRSPSLLERMTALSRHRDNTAEKREEPVLDLDQPIERDGGAAAAESTEGAGDKASRRQGARTKTPHGPTASDRMLPPVSDEDQLEIPAFLRRRTT